MMAYTYVPAGSVAMSGSQSSPPQNPRAVAPDPVLTVPCGVMFVPETRPGARFLTAANAPPDPDSTALNPATATAVAATVKRWNRRTLVRIAPSRLAELPRRVPYAPRTTRDKVRR